MKTITEHDLLLKVGKLNEAVALYELARTDANGNEYQGRGRENDTRGRENDPRSTPPGKWPATDAEIRTFQQSHKQLDGQPLVVDGDIGPQTMQALAAAGIQPPPGWTGLKPAAPKVTPPKVTPPKVTPPHGNTAPKVTPPTMQRQSPDPKVVAIQQDLMAKGWPLQPTGIMDQNTSDAYEAQFRTDSMNNALHLNTQPEHSAAYNDAYATAIKNMDPNQTPAPTDTPIQQPAAKFWGNPKIPYDPNARISESVTFGEDESLARIVQLVNW
jgi:hypothetical protein